MTQIKVSVKTIYNESEMSEAKITKGTYKTSDYRVVKTYKSAKWLKKFLQKLNFPYSEVDNGDTWNRYGVQYTVSITY